MIFESDYLLDIQRPGLTAELTNQKRELSLPTVSSSESSSERGQVEDPLSDSLTVVNAPRRGERRAARYLPHFPALHVLRLYGIALVESSSKSLW